MNPSPRISLHNVEDKARDSYHTQEGTNRKVKKKKGKAEQTTPDAPKFQRINSTKR